MTRLPERRARVAARRAGLVLGLVVVAGGVAACVDADPSSPTQLPPDATQPVNSMTQDSAMVPGGELNPQPDPENP